MVIKVHNRAKSQFDQWVSSLGVDNATRKKLAKSYWQEFTQEVERTTMSLAKSSEKRWVVLPPCYMAMVWFRDKDAIVLEMNFSPFDLA